MNLQKIRQIIQESETCEKWEDADCIVSSIEGKERKIVFYKDDVNLRLEINTDENEGKISENWLHAFSPEKAIYKVICRVYYGNTLIENQYLLSIDDGSAYLPLPSTPTKLTTHLCKARLARLATYDDEIFDKYMKQAGITLVD